MHDGTLSNQGLSEINVRDKGTSTISNDGKIGKCYYLDGTSYMTLSSNMMEFIKDHPFSYGCWFKTSGLAEGMSLCGILAFTYGCSMYISSSGHLGARIDDGTILQTFSTTPNLFDSKWHHLFLTYDGAIAKIYIDGAVAGNMNIVFKNRYSNIGAIGVEINNPSVWIGKGYINDVRVYDHCLSAKEVKLLSQGLILHYPLNQIDRSKNLLKTSNKIVLSGSDYPSSTSRENGKITVLNNEVFNAYTWVQGNLAISIQDLVKKPGEQFTFSCKIKTKNLTKSGLILSIDTRTDTHQNKNITSIPIKENLNDIWQELFGTFKITYTDSTRVLICISSAGATGFNGVVLEYKDFKLEYGFNPHPHWTPAWEDSDSWLDTTEYDTSGLCNNGSTILPPPLKKSESPRYDGCYEFNGSLSDGKKNNDAHIIENTSLIIPRDEITICYWRKRSVVGCAGGSYFTIDNSALSYYDSYGITTYDNHYRINLINTANDKTYMHLSCISLNAEDIGKWEFHSFTFDGTTAKAFINAKLLATVSKNEKYKIAVSGNNGLTIGYSKAGGVYRYFNGCMSDFRIYCTCLSDADIKSMYDTAASITKNGTLLLSGELIEN